MMLNPIQRMSKERRLALVFFNVLLILAAMLQLFSAWSRDAMPKTAPSQVVERAE